MSEFFCLMPRQEDDLHEEGAVKENAISHRWREVKYHQSVHRHYDEFSPADIMATRPTFHFQQGATLGAVYSGEGEDATHEDADGLDDV